MNPVALLPRPVSLARVDRNGETHEVAATEDERARIKGALELLDLPRLAAGVTLARSGSTKITVTGQIDAELVQACVVTLEPVTQRIEQAFERRFVPSGEAAGSAAPSAIDVAPEGEDPPDVYEADRIDIGAVVMEELILAIDPYPRAPGAELPEEATDDADEAPESPFAALKTLGHGRR